MVTNLHDGAGLSSTLLHVICIDTHFSAVYRLLMDIIAHIRDSGKTVVQVCREAGVTRQTFYSAIKPGANPKRETLKAIASATGLAMDQIGEKQ